MGLTRVPIAGILDDMTTTTETTPTPKFRHIAGGLYGTGIHRHEGYDAECGYLCDEHDVEVVIDHFTDEGQGWTIRYLCACGQFTESLGAWYRTLTEAKAFISQNPNRA